jgi:quercetin dioxygenase-like cupin family protein
MKRSRAITVVLLAAATSAARAEVTYLPADEVSGAFAKGSPLLEVENYKLHASRREAAGQAEIHTRDTDLIYVLDGEATFVTGGKAVDAKEIAAEEIRGARIDGGTTRTLRKGDVIVVPNGTPHWFEGVKPPFLYYVVKVRSPE